MNDAIFKERKDGLLEYCGPTDNPSLAVEKWRELDATIDIGIWGQASIAAAIEPVWGQETVKEFAQAVEKSTWYIRQMGKTYRYYTQKATRVANLSFKHHTLSLRHQPNPEHALMKAAEHGWSCVRLEEWIINEAQKNSAVKKAVRRQRQNDLREFLERVDGIIINDFMATCPNAEFGRRVFKGWREDVAWELSQIDHAEKSEQVNDAVQSGALTIQDIRAATGLRTSEIEGVVGIQVAEGTLEWIREGGETEMARGTRRSILHVVGTAVAR